MISSDPLIPVALVVPRTEAEGPGIRSAVWVQGCPRGVLVGAIRTCVEVEVEAKVQVEVEVEVVVEVVVDAPAHDTRSVTPNPLFPVPAHAATAGPLLHRLALRNRTRAQVGEVVLAGVATPVVNADASDGAALRQLADRLLEAT